MSDQKQKMRPAETARYAGLGNSTLARLRSGGGGPKFSKVGRIVVYDRQDVDMWLADRLCRSTADYVSLDKRAR